MQNKNARKFYFDIIVLPSDINQFTCLFWLSWASTRVNFVSGAMLLIWCFYLQTLGAATFHCDVKLCINIIININLYMSIIVCTKILLIVSDQIHLSTGQFNWHVNQLNCMKVKWVCNNKQTYWTYYYMSLNLVWLINKQTNPSILLVKVLLLEFLSLKILS